MGMGKFYLAKSSRTQRKAKRAVTAPKVSKTVKEYVHRTINSDKELKRFLSTASGTIDYDVSAVVSRLSTVVQGDDVNDREGNVIKPTKLSIRWTLTGTAGAASIARIIILQWHKDSAVDTPSISAANVLDQTAGAVSQAYSPFIFDNLKYMKVLYDRNFVMEKNTMINSVRKGKISIKGSRLNNIKFNDDSVTDGKDHLYIISVSDQTNASGNAPTLVAISELFYKE